MAPWEDDNDPRAKGLRGWDAARALCIGTGRALRDVKSVVNLAPWVTKKQSKKNKKPGRKKKHTCLKWDVFGDHFFNYPK